MKKKAVSGIMLTLLVISMLTLTFNIQPVKAEYGTIYIRADGSIDPPTANITSVDNVTYTFTENINDELVVERDNIVVDGAGYILQGTGGYPSKGIDLTGRSNVTIKNVKIKEFYQGIFLSGSSNNHIYQNNITANTQDGICLWTSSHNNTISGNNITANNIYGIRLYSSSDNTVFGNHITNNHEGVYLWVSSNNTVSENNLNENIDIGLWFSDNSDYNRISGNNITNSDFGIILGRSSNNLLRNCTMINNQYHFGVWGDNLSDFVNDVDVSNTVNGKPMNYWVNVHEATMPIDAGYIALVNCTKIMVRNVNLRNNEDAILLAGTHNSTIAENNLTSNDYGVTLWNSSNNIITKNNVTNNEIGIYFESSSNNIVSKNEITRNYYGIYGWISSSNNSISGNNIANNEWGIDLEESSNNNIICVNNITNTREGIYLGYSSDNIISGNHIENNEWGFDLVWSSNNTIHHNSVINNTHQADSWQSANMWDNGYPSGGNYWSDYNGTDFYYGQQQNKTGSDGIGDIPYAIDANNTDRYPLMNPWGTIETSVEVEGTNYPVIVVSNTTISQIATTQNTLSFNSSGSTGEKGYINVVFPMVNTTVIEVFIDGNKLTPPPFPVINSNGTHYFIYFEFTLSTHNITIQFATTPAAVGGIYIPVNKLALLAPYIALTILLAVAVATVVYVKKRKRNSEIIS